MRQSSYENKLRVAILEAEAFVKAANILLAKASQDSNDSFARSQAFGNPDDYINNLDYWMRGSRLSGDVKRRSMDLTRSLVELRKPL